MAIVTFWNNGKEQTGKTLSLVAISTDLAMDHNYRILVISTAYKDETLDNCFWSPTRNKKNLGLFGPNTNVAMEEGIVGLVKVMRSNKLSADYITNYTRIIFKDRLEILPSFKGSRREYDECAEYYSEVITLANNYYDLVLVDLDKTLPEDIAENILNNSNLIIANLSQRLTTLNTFQEIRQAKPILNSRKTLLLIGKYDKYSKYNIKNISRYLGERNKILTMPYNTLFFEACEEASVPEYFLKLKRTGEDDRNGFFVAEIKRAVDNIIYRLEDLNLKM